MLRTRLVFASAILLLASACGGAYSAPSPVPTPSPSPAPVGSSTPITIPVGASTLGSRAFNPAQLDVPVGTTVTWTNSDSTAHTTTSDGAGWNSGTLQPRAQFSTTFSDAGTFRYHCAIHPDMVGTVIVH
jgi:plastocyanin